jgi:hypothetical protein
MTAGTFAVSRRIWHHPEFAPSAFSEREAFLWLVSEASWKPRRVRAGDCVVDLDRGQLAASVRFIAAAWKWTPAKVQRFIFRMKNAAMIRVETDTGVSVITLCNYDEYQHSAQGSDTGPIQDRYRTDTNYKKDVIREEGEAKASLVLSAPEPSLTSEAVEIYNATAEATGWPKVQKLSPARSQALKARLKDCGGIEGWRIAMDKGKASHFLTGRTPKPFTGCGFDWITKAANFTKLMEGNYDNRDSNAPRLSNADTTASEIAFAARFGRSPDINCF